MSYYYKDKNTGDIYSNVSSIEGAKEIKTAYRYKTLLQPIDGLQYGHQSFYIKDGSLPIFVPKYKDNEDIIEDFSASYSPIMQVCISSISGKYHLSNIADGAGLYYIPKNTTPMLYKTEMFKRNQDLYEPEISLVNYNKGGKVSWRVSEENLKYFNPTQKGPTKEYYVQKNYMGSITWYCGDSSAYDNNWTDNYNNRTIFLTQKDAENLNDQISNPGHAFSTNTGTSSFDVNTSATILNKSFNSNFRNSAFVFINENTTTTINPTNNGYFISATPTYNEGVYCSNAFGFNIPTLSGHHSAPHFTLNINDITANGYTNLNIKIDGLYLYANNCFGEVKKTSITPDIKYIRNSAAFNGKYCQGLFYAINNDHTWDIDTISSGEDYLGNGIIFSNLKESTTSPGRLEVKNPADYNDYSNMCEWKYVFNDTFVSEKQSLDDSNVWNHMVLQDVADNKMYSNVNTETGVCPNSASHHISDYCYEECSYCKDKVYNDTNNIRYLECKNINNESLVKLLTTSPRFNNLTAKHTSSFNYRMTTNTDEDVIGLKVPVYTAVTDSNPYGYLVCGKLSVGTNYITTNKGTCCDGTGLVNKLSGSNNQNHWITHQAGDGWNSGEREYIQCYTDGYTRDNRPAKPFTNSTLTTACPYCNGSGFVECYCSCDNKDGSFIKTTDNKYALGKIKDKLCSGTGKYYPYKNNYRFYKFKFYGKDIDKAFEGYIESTDITGNGVSIPGLTGRTTFNVNYEKKDWSACSAVNWNIDKPTTNKNGCYSYAEVAEKELTNYREIIFGDSTKRRGTFIGSAVDKNALSNVSSNWLLYSYTGNTGYNYYYGHGYNPTMGRIGISNDFNCDLMYKCTDKNTDKFGNILPSTAQEFKSEGYTPSAGTNYTISNVILTANIDLTTANGDYLHLCYPYVTMLNNPDQNVANAGIISQMIMTYEAE